MTHTNEDHIPADLASAAEQLGDEMPGASSAELDRIKQRVTAGSRSRGSAVRSRLAIALMLALGGVVSTSGVALGVSAISSQGSAGAAQYDPDNGGGGGGDEDEGDGDGDEGRQLSASSGDD